MAATMVTLAASVPADLAERIQRLAEENGRSVDHEIRAALRDHIALEWERREREAEEG
jgi:hypothetical protein